jgi:hypothetical protein
MMTDEERTEALDRAHLIYHSANAPRRDNLLAVALLEATQEVAKLQPKAPRLTTDERAEALDAAKRILRFDTSEPYERVLANGLLAERAEADRLGSLLDEVRGFLAQHALAADPRNVLANVLLHIDTHRRAK